MKRQIKSSAYYGIIALVFLIPLIILEFLKVQNLLDGLFLVLYSATYFFYTIFLIFFLLGFVNVGRLAKVRMLTIVTYILLMFVILNGIISIFQPFLPSNGIDLIILLFAIGILFSSGLLIVLFGVGLIMTRKTLGGLAMGAGILNIIVGTSFMVVLIPVLGLFFFYTGLILLIPATIAEILLLFHAAEKL